MTPLARWGLISLTLRPTHTHTHTHGEDSAVLVHIHIYIYTVQHTAIVHYSGEKKTFTCAVQVDVFGGCMVRRVTSRDTETRSRPIYYHGSKGGCRAGHVFLYPFFYPPCPRISTILSSYTPLSTS